MTGIMNGQMDNKTIWRPISYEFLQKVPNCHVRNFLTVLFNIIQCGLQPFGTLRDASYVLSGIIPLKLTSAH